MKKLLLLAAVLCAACSISCQEKEGVLEFKDKFNDYFVDTPMSVNMTLSYEVEASDTLLVIQKSPPTVRFIRLGPSEGEEGIVVNELPKKDPTIRFPDQKWGPIYSAKWEGYCELLVGATHFEVKIAANPTAQERRFDLHIQGDPIDDNAKYTVGQVFIVQKGQPAQ